MVQGNNLVRPLPSTISSSTSSIMKAKRSRGSGNYFLWTLCVFLLILCVLLLTALVMIGQRNATFTKVNDHRQSADGDDVFVVGVGRKVTNQDNFNKSVIVLPNSVGGLDNDSRQSDSESADILDRKMAQRFANQLTFRLQRDIRPLLYKLDLFPDLNTKNFTGSVEIELEVKKPVDFIAIHSKFLQITNTSLVSLANDPVNITATYPFDQYEYWVTEFAEPIESGKYKFSLDFNGSLVDRIVGFYSSSYYSPTRNTTRPMATSKFEPTYARQAFPCFDEPDKKAEFEISVVRPTGDDFIALSNMNELSSIELDDREGLTRTTFNKSVPMSTYLACFIVCDFAKKSAVIDSKGIGQNVELRVYATPHQVHKVDLALKAAKIATEYYMDYFGIPYALPKLDLIAIPEFVSGAMEHWGLVTFRETALLYEKGLGSSRNKQRVVVVVAHELAHQWFGNLVTMEFWNDLWLNEGFASYMEYKGTEAVFPDWGMRDQMLIEDFHRVVSLDASLATHPIVQNVSNPNQITEIFDAITYSKGATVIRMLEDIIGPENFRQAVRNYLNRHKYGNAVTDDLLTEIEKLDLGMDIKVILDTWTRQSGLPVVRVERAPDSNNSYILTQKRFFSNPENEDAELPPSDFNYRWYIPITYSTDNDANVTRMWFPHTDSQLRVEVADAHKWIKFNKNSMGYYIVNYPPDVWVALTSALKENHSAFSVSDRVQLLKDAFMLAEATQLEYKVALDMTRYLVAEKEYVPWRVAVDSLTNIRQLIYREPVVEKFTEYGLKMIDNIYSELGWDVNEEEHLKNFLRSEVLALACRFGHPECLDRVGGEFRKWLANPSARPHPDVRTAIYNYGMEVAGNETTWKQVWELFATELDAEEKVKLMSSLSRVQDPSILSRFIKLAWDEKNVRRQDYFSCLTYIAGNRVGEPLVWDYVRSNWPEMVKRFGLNERYLGKLIPDISKNFATEMRLKEMKEFFEKYPEAGAGALSRKIALEKIQQNIKWLDSNLESLSDWLNVN